MIIPMVVLLTFGVIELGFAFNEQGTVRAGTRTAARAASAVPGAEITPFDNAALDTLNTSVSNLANGRPVQVWIYKAVEVTPGQFERPAVCTLDCHSYQWDVLNRIFDPATLAGENWERADRRACPGDSDRVGVFLEVQHNWLTGLPPFSAGFVTLTSDTIMALEPLPGGGGC